MSPMDPLALSRWTPKPQWSQGPTGPAPGSPGPMARLDPGIDSVPGGLFPSIGRTSRVESFGPIPSSL